MKLSSAAVVGFAGTVLAFASYAAQLEFDSASVKPNAAGDHRMVVQLTPGGRFSATGATLKELIRVANGLQDFQIAGGPPWTSSDRWDVQAKADAGIAQKQINEMLKNLLMERFQLKVHRESRKGAVYELIAARNGPKLHEMQSDGEAGHDSSRTDQHQSHGAGSHGGGTGMTMPQLAEMLSNIVGRNVVDKTGLRGRYDVRLSWRPDPGQTTSSADHLMPERTERGDSSDPNAPSIFTAVQEQLGLQLRSAKGQSEVLVIDSAQKPARQP